MWDFLDYGQPPAPSAARYEGGTPNFFGIAAIGNSLEVLAAADPMKIGEHVIALTDHLVDGLHRIGAEIDTERGRGHFVRHRDVSYAG